MAIEKVQQNSVYKGVFENSSNEIKKTMKEGEQKNTLQTQKIQIENKGVRIDTKA